MTNECPPHPIPGALWSGEVFHNLYRDKQITVYLFSKKKLFQKWQLVTDGKEVWSLYPHMTPQKFDFSGLLHVINSEDWESAIFDNFWLALAYARKYNIKEFPTCHAQPIQK